MIPRWQLEALEEIPHRVGVTVTTGGVGDAGSIELGGDFASGMQFGEGIDVGEEGRGDHRRFVPRARQPHGTL